MSVFESGSEAHRDTIRPLVLQGLDALAQKLIYGSHEDYGNGVHTLRYLCVRLACVLSRVGFRDDAVVSSWLDIGREDPFPEPRSVVLSYDTDAVRAS